VGAETASSDPFEALGLEARFDLTLGEIERAYLSRAAAAHPDASDEGDAARRMASLNDARSTLRDGERRARALLIRLGLGVPDDRSLPDGFLESMLETRMEIEGAISGGDPAERESWVRWAEARRTEHASRIQTLFGSLDESGADAIGAEIRVELNAWRYIERLIEQLDPGYNPEKADFA